MDRDQSFPLVIMCTNTDNPNPRDDPKKAPDALKGEVNAPATAPVPIINKLSQ